MAKYNAKKLLVIVILGYAAISVAGCASGQKFKPANNVSQDKALIYIYRPNKGLVGAGFDNEIYINNRLVGKLANNGYCYDMSSESNITISTKTKSNALTWGPLMAIAEANSKPMELSSFRASPDKEYYFRFDVFDKVKLLKRIDKEVALREIGKCRLQNKRSKKVKK